MASALKKKKKKIRFYIYLYKYIKRALPEGYIINIHISKSNILLSACKGTGDLLFCFTQGMVWNKYLKKGSEYAGLKVGYIFGRKVFAKCYFPIILKIRTRFSSITEAVLAGLLDAGLYFRYCILVPAVKFNGCRTRRKKRKKYRIRKRYAGR